jgi:hypothetical protein
MMATKTRYLLVGLGVISALLIGEVSLRVVEARIPMSTTWPSPETHVKSAQLANLGQDVEILFLGSSITEAAVDPALLMALTGSGLAYNSALPFSSPLSNELWLDEVALAYVSPSTVIIGVPAWPTHSTSEDDTLQNGIQQSLAGIATPTATSSLALARSKGVLADWEQRSVGVRLSESGLWTDLGHMTGYYESSGGTLAGRFPPYGAPTMSSDNLAALTRTVSALTQEGIEVVVMIEPGSYPGQFSDSEVESYLTSIRDFGHEMGIPVWDTYSVGWDSRYHADEAHFNREGTIAFTTYLAGLVSELDP